ncbi:Beta-mannosidase, partial [Armadillidium nasatum]
ISVGGSVPGGVYTDLLNGGVLNQGDFYYLPESLFENEKVVLEFDGLDTAAEILLQDTTELGRAQNMFSKYLFDITNYSEQMKGEAKLSIIFRSPVNFSRDQFDSYIASYGYEIPPECLDPVYQGECHANMIRKMQASFSWDWGPAFPNAGIWKAWRIVGWSSAKLSSISVFPKPDAYFDLASNVSLSGTLQISVGGTEYFNSEVFVNENSFVEDSFKIPEDTVETWWPNGYGNQPLYDIIVTFTPNDFPDDGVSSLTKRIGFRTIELDQSFVDDSDQSIEQVTPPYTRLLLEAARDTHQNCLRVWGGGIYESDEFYEFADEFGLLIWEDMMFACSMYPADDNYLDSVRSETRTQIRRLQHHPCILLWATNNENESALRSNW